MNRISGVIVSVFTVSVVDCGFKPNWVKANYYKIDIFCFSTAHIIKSDNKDWMARKQHNVLEGSDLSLSILGLLS